MSLQGLPRWVFFGGFALALIAGMVNAVGFLSLYHGALSHVTGTVTSLGVDFVAGRSAAACQAILLIAAFLCGSMLCGIIIKNPVLHWDHRYGSVLLTEASLLLLGMLLMQNDYMGGAWCAAAACGLQNALATSYSGTVIRTTHMSGIATDIGLALGQWIRGVPLPTKRLLLWIGLAAGFLAGSTVGAWGFTQFSYGVLLAPAGLCIGGAAITVLPARPNPAK